MADNKAKDNTNDDTLGSIKLWSVETFGYIVAGCAAIATALASIGNEFYKNIHDDSDSFIRDLKKWAKDTYREIDKGKWENKVMVKPPVPVKEQLAARYATREEYMQRLNGHLSDLGIRDSWILGTWDKYKNLHFHQKFQVGIAVTAVSSIAMVAALSMVRSKALAREIKRQEQEKQSGQKQV